MRVIADIHGMKDMLDKALSGTKGPYLFLGDLIDRGPDSPGVLRTVLDLVERGEARLVQSNHDDKLYRYYKGRPVKIGTTLGETIAQMDKAKDKDELIKRFLKAFEEAPIWIVEGQSVFAHGAIHADMLKPEKDIAGFSKAKMRALRARALFGEVKDNGDTDKPVRLANWVEDIPKGMSVYIGHEALSQDKPVWRKAKSGGRALYLDTGCGKGGPLSYIDLPKGKIGQIMPN